MTTHTRHQWGGFGSADAHESKTLKDMIAEAAYYKAEKRCFEPGQDKHDWLQAEKDILAQIATY